MQRVENAAGFVLADAETPGELGFRDARGGKGFQHGKLGRDFRSDRDHRTTSRSWPR
jgi:hypothetical protein